MAFDIFSLVIRTKLLAETFQVCCIFLSLISRTVILLGGVAGLKQITCKSNVMKVDC